MKNLLLIALCAISFGAAAQMQIDKALQLTGSGTDARIEGIEDVSANDHAANKIYVDTSLANALSNLGGSDPCDGVTSVSYDGHNYSVVAIGTQCWFAENLQNTVDASSSSITRQCPDNNASNCPTYGGLYNWATAMNGGSSSWEIPSGVQGICPNGWHLPSDPEWDMLVDVVASSASKAGLHLKETGTAHWDAENVASNSVGFNAIGGGFLTNTLAVSSFRTHGRYWTSTELYGSPGSGNAQMVRFIYNSSSVGNHDNDDKTRFFSIRCVKD